MEDTFANIVPLAFLGSDNELSDEELEVIDDEEDFYDFVPFQQEFLAPLRDRAFSWDISLEDGLHGEILHNLPTSSSDLGSTKLVIKAKRMSVPIKTEPGVTATSKTENKNDANKKNNNKSNNGANSNKKKDSDGAKTDSPPKNTSSSSLTALAMKPPTKPPSHSTNSLKVHANNTKPILSNIDSNTVSGESQSLTVSSLDSVTSYQQQLQQGTTGSSEFAHEIETIFNYVGNLNDVNDQMFDNSVSSLERIMMAPESNEVSGKHTPVPTDSQSYSKPSPHPPMSGVHTHNMIGSSPNPLGMTSVDGSSFNVGTPGSSTPSQSSLMSKSGIAGNGTGMSSYSPGVVGSDGIASSSTTKLTPLPVHQHSTNPYTPYTPVVPGVGGLNSLSSTNNAGTSSSMGLLGSASSGIAGMNSSSNSMLGLNAGGLHTNTIMPSNNPNGEYRVGAYTREERQMKIDMFRAKKRKRIWRKQIKYDCRKRLADTRPRVKGRFVSRKLGDNDDMGAFLGGGMLDDEMDGSGQMMDPHSMMMMGGNGMMMMGHMGGMKPNSGQKLSKKQKSELQALQIQQRYAAAVYGGAADPSMMFMGGDPQQMMYHMSTGMDYMGAGGMLGMMGTDGMSSPQLQGLLNFNPTAFSPGGENGPLLQQHPDMFLTSEQLLLKQQMMQQHLLQQQQQMLYRESLNTYPNSSSGSVSLNGANNMSYLNSISALNNSSVKPDGAGGSSSGNNLTEGLPSVSMVSPAPITESTVDTNVTAAKNE